MARPVAAQQGLGPVYNPANGHWYQAVPIPGGIAWPTARAAAAAQSYAGYPGHLATITSPDETQFLVSHLPLGLDNHWRVGGFQDQTAPGYSEPAGGWRWVTGEPWSYTNWHAGEPNNFNGENLLEIHSDGTWNDTADQPPGGGYIVEFEPPAGSGFPAIQSQLQLFPNPVVGGQPAIGALTLASPAAGGAVVSLTSSNPAAAVVPAVVTVPPGASAVTFPVVTFPIPEPTPVTISAGGPFGAATAVLLVQPGTVNSPPGNLLVNGSFEAPRVPDGQPYATLGAGALPGWRILKGTVDVDQQWQPAPDGGTQSLDLVGTPGAGTIEQSFPTQPGREYVFSGWLSHDYGNNTPDGRADVYIDGAFFTQLYHNAPTSQTDMRWVPFSFPFRATGAVTTLTLTDVTGRGDFQGAVLDGLAVTPADQPGPPSAPTAPAAPTNLAVTAVSAHQATLAWTDRSDNETAFAIWRKGAGSDWARVGLVSPNVTTFVDSGLTVSATYTYRVRAINNTGPSDWTNKVTATTLGIN